MSTVVPSARPIRIYLSSTRQDLHRHRTAVLESIRRLGHQRFVVDSQEGYTAEGQYPLERCLNDVRNCDVYLGLFAFRYGFIPLTNNPDELAITELEYREAVRHRKEILILLASEDVSDIPPRDMDTDRTRINALRAELQQDYLRGEFTSADTAATRAVEALSNFEQRVRNETPASEPIRTPGSTHQAPIIRQPVAPGWRWWSLVLLVLTLFVVGVWFRPKTPTVPFTRWYGPDELTGSGLSEQAITDLDRLFHDARNQVLSAAQRPVVDRIRRDNKMTSEQGDVVFYVSNGCRYPQRIREVRWPEDWNVHACAYLLEETSQGIQRPAVPVEGRRELTFGAPGSGFSGQQQWIALYLFPLDATTARNLNWKRGQIIVSPR